MLKIQNIFEIKKCLCVARVQITFIRSCENRYSWWNESCDCRFTQLSIEAWSKINEKLDYFCSWIKDFIEVFEVLKFSWNFPRSYWCLFHADFLQEIEEKCYFLNYILHKFEFIVCSAPLLHVLSSILLLYFSFSQTLLNYLSLRFDLWVFSNCFHVSNKLAAYLRGVEIEIITLGGSSN